MIWSNLYVLMCLLFWVHIVVVLIWNGHDHICMTNWYWIIWTSTRLYIICEWILLCNSYEGESGNIKGYLSNLGIFWLVIGFYHYVSDAMKWLVDVALFLQYLKLGNRSCFCFSCLAIVFGLGFKQKSFLLLGTSMFRFSWWH